MKFSHAIHSSANVQSNPSLLNSASMSSSINNNSNANGDLIQWPTLYATIENMSLDERRMRKQQQKSQTIPGSISMQTYNDQINQQEQQARATSSSSNRYGNHSFRSQGHGRASYHQQNPSNNNFYRQTSVTPRILNSSSNDDQRSNQSPSAYFGSGSNVGRGRPMTGDR
jgi:hypothetical protein